MAIQQFLDAVWPTAGPYLLATPISWVEPGTNKQRTGFRHHVVHSTAEAEALGQQLRSNEDVYYALGSIHENRKKKVRIQSNIKELRSFWLDVDVKQEEGHYSSIQEAGQAIKQFCQDTALPKPLFVQSGSGLHVYWPLTEAIDAAKWQHYASLLKELTKARQVLVDQSRTSDCSSVLRPVGTYNWKTGQAQPVKVLSSINGPIDTRTMLARIAAAAERFNVQPPTAGMSTLIPGQNPAAQQASKATAQQAGIEPPEDIPSNPKKVVSKCQQLMWQAEHPDDVDEPQWYAMIGCLRHADKGEKAVHLMSKKYSGYDPNETQRKIEQHKQGGFGPTTCVAFDSARPGGCEGCPHRGKITTPLQLGRERQQAETPVVAVHSPQGQTLTITLPEPPYPFKRILGKEGRAYIAITITNEDNSKEDQIVYEHDIYPSGLIYDERENKYFVTICRYLPRDGWATFDVALGKFFDKKNLAITLGDIGVLPSIDKLESVVYYMIGYIQKLQHQAKAAMLYAKLGWREDEEFVLPSLVLRKGEEETVTPGRNIINALSWTEPQGDIEQWKQVAALYEQPGLESLQFGFGVGFAAPLFRFTNYNGMIVSMVGEKGCGKSSALMLANSIWGHKTFGWVDSQHDTLRAFYNKLGVLNNLPASYDEITNLDSEMLSDLCYSVSKGQGRQRLERDGSAKENFGSWQTMMATTANTSLHSRLSFSKADASAEAVRVFEYYVPSKLIEKPVADAAFDKLNWHYGLAGPIFMKAVMADVPAARAAVKRWMLAVEQQAQITSGERFWSAAPACVLAGFEIANAAGLTNVDLNRLLSFAVETIKSMRSSVEVATRTGMSVLSDYLNGNLQKTLTISAQPAPGKVPMISQEPRGELRIRYEAWHHKLFLDRVDFRRFCIQQSVDPNRLKEELQRKGVLLQESRVMLGKHTNFGHGQTWCWVLDMSHPSMGGAQAAIGGSSQDVAQQAIATAQEHSK